MGPERAVRVVTEVAAVDRAFDYAVSEATTRVQVGDRVRVNFNNRSVRGWVVADASDERDLKSLVKWLGFGPPASMLVALQWASSRWYGPLARFLSAASPKRIVSELSVAPERRALSVSVAASAVRYVPGVIQLAPTTDPLAVVLGAYEAVRNREGSLVVLVPTESWGRRLRGRLEQRGLAVASGDEEWDKMRSGWPVIVGSRGGALAPTPRLAGAVVIDADDEAYRSEATPTWEATAMLRERCRLDDAPMWATSMIPSPSLLNAGAFERERDLVGGWPCIEVVDRRSSDPHDGVLARDALDACHRALRGDDAVAVVIISQRLGVGRLLACVRCGELARCATCGQAEGEAGALIACRDAHEPREQFCRHCGATALKRVRSGVTTLARDVAAQLGQDVSEVTATSDTSATLARVVVGTEAIFQRVRRAQVAVFVDFDQYLLAPRESARRQAVIAVGKAGRLVGSRREARGSVVVQTRRSNDLVISSLVSADFDELIRDDEQTAKILGLAPYGARAEVVGAGAQAFVDQLDTALVRVRGGGEHFEVRAVDNDALARALSSVVRPSARVRVAVN